MQSRTVSLLFRGKGEDMRPRTQKNPRPRTAPTRTDPLEAKDRNARGQGPGTQAQVLCEKKVFQKNFRRFPKKKKSSSKIFFRKRSTKF